MRRVILAGLIVLLVSAPRAAADGMVFIEQAVSEDSARMPDQAALITFADGEQTLAIETRFIASGAEFGWVVPLPSRPVVSPATRGTFPSLRAVFAPRVRSGPPIGVVATLLVVGAILLALLVGVRIPMIAWLIGLACAAWWFLPGLGTTRGLPSGSDASVEIVDRTILDDFEVTTIASKDPGALRAWLAEHSFKTPPQAIPVIDDYVARGWVFACTRLRAKADTTAPRTPQPLVFRFATREPVYPMRLTGVRNGGPLALDLYVFGPGTASVPGLSVRASGPVVIQPHGRAAPPRNGSIGIAHAAIGALVAGAPCATHLSGTLSPEQLAADMPISFGEARTRAATAYSERGARRTTLLAGALGGIAFAAGSMFASYRRRLGFDARILMALVSMLGALGSGGLFFATATVVPTREVGWHEARFMATEAYDRACATIENHTSSGTTTNVEALRAATRLGFGALARENNSEHMRRHPMVLDEGDAPGQWHIRESPKGPEFVVVDLRGREYAEPLFR